jgi:hypothetical protein
MMVVLVVMVAGHDCKRGILRGSNQQEGRGGKERVLGVKRIEVCHIYK